VGGEVPQHHGNGLLGWKTSDRRPHPLAHGEPVDGLVDVMVTGIVPL
jgi:hypothetical protein